MTDIKRMVLLGIKDEDFEAVKKLLDEAGIDFWLNNPQITSSKVMGVESCGLRK